MNDLKVSDIMCKWYIWAVVGYVIGKNFRSVCFSKIL